MWVSSGGGSASEVWPSCSLHESRSANGSFTASARCKNKPMRTTDRAYSPETLSLLASLRAWCLHPLDATNATTGGNHGQETLRRQFAVFRNRAIAARRVRRERH